MRRTVLEEAADVIGLVVVLEPAVGEVTPSVVVVELFVVVGELFVVVPVDDDVVADD